MVTVTSMHSAITLVLVKTDAPAIQDTRERALCPAPAASIMCVQTKMTSVIPTLNAITAAAVCTIARAILVTQARAPQGTAQQKTFARRITVDAIAMPSVLCSPSGRQNVNVCLGILEMANIASLLISVCWLGVMHMPNVSRELQDSLGVNVIKDTAAMVPAANHEIIANMRRKMIAARMPSAS